jgi:uncharacterized protein YjbI with pentapeptide repeats
MNNRKKLTLFATVLTACAIANTASAAPTKANQAQYLTTLKDTNACKYCDLSGADLSGLNLTGADLTGANLNGANLTNTNFTNANLTGANLVSATTVGTVFRNTTAFNAQLYVQTANTGGNLTQGQREGLVFRAKCP